MENIFTIPNIIIYVICINLFTFFVMWLDKRKAKKGKWRIPENSLLLFVLLGGGIGGIAGMYVFLLFDNQNNRISFHKNDTIILKSYPQKWTYLFQLFTELSTFSTVCVLNYSVNLM